MNARARACRAFPESFSKTAMIAILSFFQNGNDCQFAFSSKRQRLPF